MLGKSSKVKRRRKHGFLQRVRKAASSLLKSRRSKGRQRLTYKKAVK